MGAVSAGDISIKEVFWMEKERSFALLISAVLGGLYCGYWVIHVLSTAASSNGVWGAVGVAIGVGLIAPHLICAFLALIFNIAGYVSCNRWLALTGAILYTVAGIVFILYLPYVAIQAVLSYVAFARMKSATAPAAVDNRAQMEYSNYKGMSFEAFVAVVAVSLALCAGGAVGAILTKSFWSMVPFAAALLILCITHEKV